MRLRLDFGSPASQNRTQARRVLRVMSACQTIWLSRGRCPGPTDLPRAGAALSGSRAVMGRGRLSLYLRCVTRLVVPSARPEAFGSHLEAAPAWFAPRVPPRLRSRVPPRLRSRSTVRGSSEAGSAAVLSPKSRAGGSPFHSAFRHRELRLCHWPLKTSCVAGDRCHSTPSGSPPEGLA